MIKADTNMQSTQDSTSASSSGFVGCKQATLWIVAVRVWFEFGSRCNFVFAKMSKYDGNAKRARAAHLRNSRSGDGRVRELGFVA
jgi:hypothetical protein